MEIQTTIDDVPVTKKQRTGAELFGPANALVVPDIVSGSAFGAVGLAMKHIRLTSSDPEEYILSEYDPHLIESLRALYARREVLRNELTKLSASISPARYHRVLRDFSSGYRVIKVVKGWREVSAYEWSIEHGSWKTVQDEERVTRTEFYERLLRYAELSREARTSALQTLRQSRLSDERYRAMGVDIVKSYVWRTNPRTIRIRNKPLFGYGNEPISQGANLHDVIMERQPIYGTKKVPNIDWESFRRRWNVLVGEIQPRQEALLQELWDVEAQIDALRPASSHRFNRCVQIAAAPITVINRSQRLLALDTGNDTFPALSLELNGGLRLNTFLVGEPTARLTYVMSEHTYLGPQTVANRNDLAGLLAGLAQECADYQETQVIPRIPEAWRDVGRCKAIVNGQFHARLTSANPGEPVHYSENVPGLDLTSSLRLSSRLVGDSVGNTISVGPLRSGNLVDEKIQSSLNALLAGRASGSDDVAFNMARSLGELKDLPQTGSQASEFAQWLLSQNTKERLYAFKVKGKSKPLYASLRCYDRKTNLLFGKYATVNYKAVRRIPTIAMLASAYLGWKFAIAPTIADANRLRRELLSDLVASRRYVTRLYRKLSTTARAVVLRKGFLVGTPVKRDKPLDASRILAEEHELPYRDSLVWSEVQIQAAMKCDATPFQVAELGLPGSKFTVPYVVTRKGLRVYLWFKTGGSSLTYDERRRCSEDAFQRALTVLPVELFADPCLYHSWVEGCVFARYGRNALSHLANDRSLAAKLDRLKVVRTAWDLSPLSFILEWFTNLGDIVQNAQDILSADSVGIMPIGGPWVRVTERFAISRISTPANWEFTQRLLAVRYHPILRVERGGLQPRDFYSARVDLFPSQIEWEWSVTDKVTGELVNRRKWLNELQPWLIRTRAAVTNRRPMKWERELPSFRPELRLDYGKGLTLLAMYLSGFRLGRVPKGLM